MFGADSKASTVTSSPLENRVMGKGQKKKKKKSKQTKNKQKKTQNKRTC